MTWKRGNSSLPLEMFLKPQESANARWFSFAVADIISWTVCLCVCLSECNMQYAYTYTELHRHMHK